MINGVTNSVAQVVQHLDRGGHQVLVIAPGADPDSYQGARVVRVPALDLPVVDSVLVGVPTSKVVTALRDFCPDVVQLASPVIVGARGLWAARRLGVPTVAALGAHGRPRVHRWAGGVDTTHVRPSRRDEQLRAQLAPHGEVLVGFVGRLAPEKKVLRLSAWHDTPGVALVVVGDGPDRRQLAKRLPRAAFLGFKTGDELIPSGVRRITLPAVKIPGTGEYRAVHPCRVRALLAGLRPDRIEVSDRLTQRGMGRWAADHGVPSVVISHERLDRLLHQFLLPDPAARRLADWANRRMTTSYDTVVCTTGFAREEFDRIGSRNAVIAWAIGRGLNRVTGTAPR